MIDINETFAKYKPTFDALNAHVYSGHESEDTLLLRWWIRLQESGDIHNLIAPDAHRLSSFLGLFRLPTTLFYSLDNENSIDNVSWFMPVDNAASHHMAYASLWSRQTKRGTRRQFHFTVLTYSLIFEFYDALLGMTWQPKLLDLHKKSGYNIVGCIPGMFDQKQCYIVHLTRESFFNSRAMQVMNRRK